MLKQLLSILIVIFMVGSLLEVGLLLKVAEALSALRNVRFVLVSLLWCFVVGPGLAVLLTNIVPMDRGYALGLIFLGMAPCSPAIPIMVRRAGGSVAYMSAFMILAFAGTMVLMPFMVPILAKGYTADAWTIAKPLLFFVAIPLVLGIVIRRIAETFAERAAPIVKKFTGLGVILLVVDLFLLYWHDIVSAIGSYAIGTQILYYALMGAASYMLSFGLSYDQKVPVTIGSCTRNVGPALAPLIAGGGAPQGAITMCIMAAVLGAILSGFAAAALLKKFCNAVHEPSYVPSK